MKAYQTLACLASVDPLLSALELYVFEFLVRTRLLGPTLRTAHVASPTDSIAVAGLLPARDDTLITSTDFTRLVVGGYLPSIRNLDALKHAAWKKVQQCKDTAMQHVCQLMIGSASPLTTKNHFKCNLLSRQSGSSSGLGQ